MTIEEAITHAKEQKEIFGGTHKEFLEMAIEALEKQIPNEPEGLRHFRAFNSYAGFCPICRCGANSEFQYCGDCGQKLEWPEVEE